MKRTQGFTIVEALIVLVLLVILWALLFPAVNGPGLNATPRAQAKNDVTQIATAVNAYETEYGHLPGQNRGDLGGKILATLMGNNTNLNPRGLVFLEVNTVTRKGQTGLSNGYFVNPWGGRYQIAFADGTNHYVTNVGTNHLTIQKRVAVWSDPELDPDAAALNEAKKSRRYVDSWQ